MTARDGLREAVPPATPLADHIKAGMLRGRVRLSDVPPDPPAADRDELARCIADPGSVVPRQDGETVARWGVRAIFAAGVLVDAADVRARARIDT